MSWIQILDYLPWIIAGASAASAAMPKAEPGSTWDMIRKGIDFAALNFGNAKNMPKGPR